MCGFVLAQGSPSVTPSVPGDTVPSWVFYWVLGLASAVGGILLLVIRILWDRGEKKSALNEEERGQLKQLYDWHNKVDDDQVPLWYTPRSLSSLTKELQQDYMDIKSLLTKIVEQGDNVTADLRRQLKERLELHDKQQNKMLKLALRVQQAIEALAGLEPPAVEDYLDDGEDS
jgi:hypothetical protein